MSVYSDAYDPEIGAMLAEADALQDELDQILEPVMEKQKRLKELKDKIKEYAAAQFIEGVEAVTLETEKHGWKVTYGERKEVDKEAMERDGVFERYTKTTQSYRLTVLSPEQLAEAKARELHKLAMQAKALLRDYWGTGAMTVNRAMFSEIANLKYMSDEELVAEARRYGLM